MELYIIFVVTLGSFIASTVLFEKSLKSFDKLAWSELSFRQSVWQSASCSLGKSAGKGSMFSHSGALLSLHHSMAIPLGVMRKEKQKLQSWQLWLPAISPHKSIMNWGGSAGALSHPH